MSNATAAAAAAAPLVLNLEASYGALLGGIFLGLVFYGMSCMQMCVPV